jgi:hypothetical protein
MGWLGLMKCRPPPCSCTTTSLGAILSGPSGKNRATSAEVGSLYLRWSKLRSGASACVIGLGYNTILLHHIAIYFYIHLIDIILYYILFFIILFFIIVYDVILHCIVLYYIILHCFVLYRIIFQYIR